MKRNVLQAVQDLLLQHGDYHRIYNIFETYGAPYRTHSRPAYSENMYTVLCLLTANFTTTVAYQSTVY